MIRDVVITVEVIRDKDASSKASFHWQESETILDTLTDAEEWLQQEIDK